MKRLWNKRVSAFLLALVMMVSLIPAAAAASADVSVSVEAGERASIGRSDFSEYYDDTFDYLEFDDYDDFDDYGYFTVTDADNNEVILDDNELDDGEFYYSSTDAAHSDEYKLITLAFEADDDAEDATLEFEFTIYDGNTELPGIMEIEIDGSSSSSSSSSTKMTLKVKADGNASFDEDLFYEELKKRIATSKHKTVTASAIEDLSGTYNERWQGKA